MDELTTHGYEGQQETERGPKRRARALDRVPSDGLTAEGEPSDPRGVKPVPSLETMSVLEHLLDGTGRAALTFAGQGVEVLPSLERLVKTSPGLRIWVEAAAEVISDCMRSQELRWSGFYQQGFDLLAWLDRPESRPSAAYLTSCTISQPLILLTQVMTYQSLYERGLSALLAQGLVPVTAGHSQGVMASMLIAESPKGEISLSRFKAYIRYMVWQGKHMAASYRELCQVEDERCFQRLRDTLEGPLPTQMAAVSGPDRERLLALLGGFQAKLPKQEQLVISLYNTRTRHVLSGPISSLLRFREMLTQRAAGEAKKKKEGRWGGAPLRFTWEHLAVSAAYHSHYMASGREAMRAQVEADGFVVDASQLQMQVLNPATGEPFATEGDLVEDLIRVQFVEPVRWPENIMGLLQHQKLDWVLDLGPGDGVARLTRSVLKGAGVHTLALVLPAHQEQLLMRAPKLPAQPLDYGAFAPTLAPALDGSGPRFRNRYTEATGHSPVILPGMTPTTVDVPIVAAAANAGFTAELAGGGQVSEDIFWKRMDELQEALEPGREVVFNALFLDPYLWQLHLGRHALVQKARKAGYPICGVTISAGLPETQDAVKLLDELNSLGIWLNAFKPGTVEQINQVINIAKAAADRPYKIFVHVEGGKAGGHHSWEDLNHLLLETYFALRSQPNIVICVGGGIGFEERGSALLTGEWSKAHGLPPMPLDAILLGTLTMACKEATASEQVKQALVDASGTDDWVFAGGAKGEITSGKSGLNADIHYIDNAAARCGRLLDQVAGDAEAVASRRDEIIEALSQTAKPYFGDLTEMTYLQLLERMVALMAVGRHGRYEDGVWPDVTYRQRLVDMIRQAEARLSTQQEGVFESFLQDPAQLDEPGSFLTALVAHLPALGSTKVHPADELYFVHKVCGRPGKPVNFVPVIDEHVRRWYKSDSLWQAQDPRYTAEQVLIIPGPEAIKGLKAANEPVAEMLGRFEAATTHVLHQSAVESSHHTSVLPDLPDSLLLTQLQDGWSLDVVSEGASHPWKPWLAGWLHSANSGDDKGDWIRCLLAPTITVGASAQTNPLHTMCQAQLGASLSLSAEGLCYKLQTEAGVEEVKITTSTEGDSSFLLIEAGREGAFGQEPQAAGEPVTFRLALRIMKDSRGVRFCCDEETWQQAVRRFYQLSMFGRLLAPTPLFSAAEESVVVSEAHTAGYMTLVGGVVDPSQIPLNMVFSLSWGPLFRLLSCDHIAGGLFHLVHQNNEVVCHEGWPLAPGQAIEVKASITRVEDHDNGRQVWTESQLTREGVPCATLRSTFFIRGHFGRTAVVVEAHETIDERFLLEDVSARSFLQEHEWLKWNTGFNPDELAPGVQLQVVAALHEKRPRAGAPSFSAKGELLLRGESIASIELSTEASLSRHPLRAMLGVLGVILPSHQQRPSAQLAKETLVAPGDMASFAEISGDHNPIHQQTLFARMGGLEAPIVHGMWTAARLEQLLLKHVADGQRGRVGSLHASFLAPVAPGAELVVDLRRVSVCAGAQEVEATAWINDVGDVVPAARVRATIAPPKTAYVFPGQGIQKQGMGMESYARSKAARSIWDRADAFTRDNLGFSILYIVRDNPKELIVKGVKLVHPQGVLHLTQFTQVAMAVLAQAQVAELREQGVMITDAITCGHSLGEYNALGAVAQVLPLEAVVEIVYRRGQVMHQLVARDERGESGYRMMVIRPHYAGLSHKEAEALVLEVKEETGAFLQIVNYNVKGRQYAVTGQIPALQKLQEVLAARSTAQGKPPCIEVPGIDVPFHSSMLRDGVPNFRDTLRTVLPAQMDYHSLLGRYIPNLVPKPFNLGRAFIEEVAQTADSHVLRDVLEDFGSWESRPSDLARCLLIELLAWQFASPVRWIETQELFLAPASMGGLGAEQVIEVGVGYQPTLANMAQYTLRLMGPLAPDVTVRNLEADFDAVCLRSGDDSLPTPNVSDFTQVVKAPVEEAKPEAPKTQAAPAKAKSEAPVVQAPAAPAPVASAGPLEDAPVTVVESLLTILALQAKVRIEQIQNDETIDDVFDGVSSRRNQLLLDLGAEFNMGPIDAAHEKPMTELKGAITKAAGRYNAPGRYLKAAQDEALKRLFGRAGLGRVDIAQHLRDVYGLEQGWVDAFFMTLVLATRTGESSRGGALGACAAEVPSDRGSALSLVDQVVQELARSRGVSIAKKSAQGGGSGELVDSAALQALEAQLLGSKGVLMNTARELATQLGHSLAPEGRDLEEQLTALSEQVALFEAEHGREYASWIAPKFSAAKHVTFASVWASARRDVARLYYNMCNDTLSAQDARQEAGRLSHHIGLEEILRTVKWYAKQAKEAGKDEVALLFEQLALGQCHESSFVPSRPSLTISSAGVLHYEEVMQRDERACEDFVAGLWPAEGDAIVSVDANGPVEDFRTWLSAGLKAPFSFAGKTALVTGASPGSIAVACVRHLLRGGARVVVTTTSFHQQRLNFYRKLYQREAVPGAELHVVPFNQASFQDVEALVKWLYEQRTEQAGGQVRVLKEAWHLDLMLPFGALKDLATLDQLDTASNAVVRGMLTGIERLVGAVALANKRHASVCPPCHVILPLSPNHGAFGGDGLYAETKAALEVLLQKWRSEYDAWGRWTTLCGARIGWVRGTGLMDDNNPVAAQLEEKTGTRTFSNEEMGYMLASLQTDEAREVASQQPLVADLTGGFGAIPDLKGTVEGIRMGIEEARATARRQEQLTQQEKALLVADEAQSATVKALPAWPSLAHISSPTRSSQVPEPTLDLSRCVVVVGAGEVGPYAGSSTRFEAEVDGTLSAGGVLELAWITGLVRYETGGRGGSWVDVETEEPIDEADIAERYREQVMERAGIRWVEPEHIGFDPQKMAVMASVFLEKDFTFPVSSEEEARSFLQTDPALTSIRWDEEADTWLVTRQAGAEIRVPKQMRLKRRVLGAVPKDFDFSLYGIPKDMLERTDRVALFNLVATVDAFIGAGLTPEELLQWVHPARVANTQGAGIGGMQSLHRLYVDHLLENERQGDILQETLINVVAAHVVQGYIGSYGAMSHPVAACATAAVSLEEGYDKLLAGKADFVVTGGFDDVGREGMLGFGDMHATADTDELTEMGVAPKQISRPNDVRRKGFVEAQGGGTILLTRADLALEMGLPVLGILGYAGSYGDGIQKSIPAPGLGALASAMGGEASPLGRALAQYGLSADDIALVSKHDTSTQANDKNENALHHHIQRSLGRTPGNPLFVVSQKSLTGHSKGGAAAWQAVGLLQALRHGRIPGNPNLDSVDPIMKAYTHLLFSDEALEIGGAGQLRAGLLTSLGFGHVSGVVLMIHADVLFAQLSDEQWQVYAQKWEQRAARARHLWAAVRLGQEVAFDKRTHRRFHAADGSSAQTQEEIEMLLSPEARLDPTTGVFHIPTFDA